MEAQRRAPGVLAVLLVAVAMSTMTIPAGIAVTDGPDDGVPDEHDILEANVTADADEVFFTIEMAGDVPEPEQDVDEFRIDFGVASREAGEADLNASASDYFVSYGSASTPSPYFLWQDFVLFGTLGQELQEQPGHGSPNITFTVQRSSLESTPGQAAEAGDRIVDVNITYLHDENVTDSVEPAGVELPAANATRELHLTGEAEKPFLNRHLEEEAPDDARPRTDVLAGGDTGALTWTSERFERPFDVEQAGADLWMSFTSTTPFLAINLFNAELHLLHPDGSQEKIAERDDVANPDSPSDPNIFTTPVVPTKMTWDFSFTKTQIPAGAQLQLRVVSEGIFGLGLQGPGTIYYDSTVFDSRVTLDGAAGEEPTIPVTDPALGEEPFFLRGNSGLMTQAEPGEGAPEPTPATGDTETTPAIWRTDQLDRPRELEDASANLWISETSASDWAGNVDVELFAVDDGQRTLLGTGSSHDAVFGVLVPGEPRQLLLDIDLTETSVPSGSQIELAVTADSFGFDRAINVWSNAEGASSHLHLNTGDADLQVPSTVVDAGQQVEFTGEIEGGTSPWTVQWVFDDGNASQPTETWDPTVTTTHTYERAGIYEPTLVVTDANGASGGDDGTLLVYDPNAEIEISDVRATADVPQLGALEVLWKTDLPGDSTVHYGKEGQPLDNSTTIDERVLDHRVVLDGLEKATTYEYQVETNGELSEVKNATTAGDFTGDSHTVVAYVDTGINPYHDAFQRADRTAHPATYIEGYPSDAEALHLDLDAPSYDAALANDSAKYRDLDRGELRWIPGTNVIAAIDEGDASAANSAEDRTPILDDDGHGTAVAGTITNANPDVLLTTIEGLSFDGIGWAADQPWIDVISVSSSSIGVTAGQSVPDSFSRVLENGKLVVYSAGNTPNHDVLFPPSNYPQTISVGGAHPDLNGTESLASKTPDVVSNFTVEAPTPDSHNETTNISGTSFATPNTAGTLSRALLELRQAQGDTGDSTLDGMTSAPAGGPYADDGRLTNLELWDAMNRSAEYWTTDQWEPSFTVPVVTATPWIQMGWGFVGPSVTDDIVTTVAGADVDEKSQAAQTWMATDRRVHQAYNTPLRDHAAGQLNGTSVPAPVYQSHELADPIQTDHPYRNDADRTWTVQVAGADAVGVHFENFTIETGFDHVSLETPGGTEVARYSQSSGADFWSAPVPGDTAVIRLVSDGSLTRHGFDVHEVGTLS